MSPTIRPAEPRDLPDIAALHIESWRDAYRGLLPDAYLGDPVAADLGALWEALSPDDLVLVAEDQQMLAGFVAFRMGAGDPLLDNLHVAPAKRGHGTGEVLLRGGARALAALGYARFWLTVIEENTRARRFYTRLGGKEGPPFEECLKGNSVLVRKVSWTHLPL